MIFLVVAIGGALPTLHMESSIYPKTFDCNYSLFQVASDRQTDLLCCWRRRGTIRILASTYFADRVESSRVVINQN